MTGKSRDEQQTDTDEELRARIAEAAYRRAEQRGFEPGYELEDWIEAEKEVTGSVLPERELEEYPED
jgi:hypothetical protein